MRIVDLEWVWVHYTGRVGIAVKKEILPLSLTSSVNETLTFQLSKQKLRGHPCRHLSFHPLWSLAVGFPKYHSPWDTSFQVQSSSQNKSQLLIPWHSVRSSQIHSHLNPMLTLHPSNHITPLNTFILPFRWEDFSVSCETLHGPTLITSTWHCSLSQLSFSLSDALY